MFVLPKNKSWSELTEHQRKMKIREIKRHFWYLVSQMHAADTETPTLESITQMVKLWDELRSCWSGFRTLVGKLNKCEWYPEEKLNKMTGEFRGWKVYLEGKSDGSSVGYIAECYTQILESLKEEFVTLTACEPTVRNGAKVGFIYGVPNNLFYWALANPEQDNTPLEWCKAWTTLVTELKDQDMKFWMDRRPLSYMWSVGSCSNHYSNMKAQHSWADSNEGWEFNKMFEANLDMYTTKGW